MMYHILIPDNVDSSAIELLQKVDTFQVNAPGKLSREDALAAVANAHAMIIRSAITADAELLNAAPNLKMIARAGVGVDNVDLQVATERGIVVMNTPDGNTISTAEFAFGLMLALARHIPFGDHSMRQGKWDRKAFMGVELRGKTLGIIGFGRIGQTVAKRALAFDMTVIAHDPFVKQTDLNVELVDQDTLYSRADFITLHTVITDETRCMINAQSLAKMKPGVRIINTARGALIDDAALAEALNQGKVAGAALDVYHQEPPPQDHPLLNHPNVIHTPHLAASTSDAQIQVAVDAAQQVIDALTKGEYRNVVNPDVLK
ncbi:MAG: hypothetical protein D6711_15520 [Chloroflexi bacterium]|nr:MAG: hypothetical protein D6711_15520 [Chloroflexota bacterium]